LRVWLTGGTGFVGSNIVHTALDAGHDVMTTVHTFAPPPDARYASEKVDMTVPDQVRGSVADFRPDLVVHCAIMNDFTRLYADRRGSWDGYVEATRLTAGAAHNAGAAYVLISTDWVFDGTQGGADESTPPNPVNLYGVLKVASEMVALERGGAVARVSGVNGIHRARPQTPRSQDPGYGYFVASLVDVVRAGGTFTVWESDDINMRATPSLASQCGELVTRIGERHLAGIFHTCGADAVGRMELARLTCDVFDLDPSRVVGGPVPEGKMPRAPIPYDTSLTAPRTRELLAHEATPVRTLLERFRSEYEAAA